MSAALPLGWVRVYIPHPQSEAHVCPMAHGYARRLLAALPDVLAFERPVAHPGPVDALPDDAPVVVQVLTLRRDRERVAELVTQAERQAQRVLA